MPSFDIVKKLDDHSVSFRVARLRDDYDVQFEHTAEHFEGNIDFPESWNIGLIVGASGTGKSTIAAELFKDYQKAAFDYRSNSVIDDMPESASYDDITSAFYSVGFASVPSWLKPYSVLSTGEKMRVDLARAILTAEETVFDEFTSVVDRQVAQVAATAISKAVRKAGKRFVAVACHYDIVEWLQPDWVFDTSRMRQVFQSARALNGAIASDGAGETIGKSLGVITI